MKSSCSSRERELFTLSPRCDSRTHYLIWKGTPTLLGGAKRDSTYRTLSAVGACFRGISLELPDGCKHPAPQQKHKTLVGDGRREQTRELL